MALAGGENCRFGLRLCLNGVFPTPLGYGQERARGNSHFHETKFVCLLSRFLRFNSERFTFLFNLRALFCALHLHLQFLFG